jgi:hypothetical protein
MNELINDAKAGGAAWDDCRTALTELLDEGPYLESRDRVALTLLRDAMNLIVERGDAVIGNLTRIQERLNHV